MAQTIGRVQSSKAQLGDNGMTKFAPAVRVGLVILGALLVVAAFVAVLYLGIGTNPPPLQIAVVTRDLPQGEQLKSTDYRVVEQIITAENVRSLITEQDSQVDLLSVDIDMNTYYVWEALANVDARVVCIEYNASFPPSVDFVVPYIHQEPLHN